MKSKPKVSAEFLSFWHGRITALALALSEARRPALPPSVLNHLTDAYFACNRAANAISDELYRKPRKARRSKKK